MRRERAGRSSRSRRARRGARRRSAEPRGISSATFHGKGRDVARATAPSRGRTMKVAVIGLGTMGAPMAANLLKGGCQVVVHNRTRGREEALLLQGAARAESPKAAAAGADAVLVCVSDSPDAEQ